MAKAKHRDIRASPERFLWSLLCETASRSAGSRRRNCPDCECDPLIVRAGPDPSRALELRQSVKGRPERLRRDFRIAVTRSDHYRERFEGVPQLRSRVLVREAKPGGQSKHCLVKGRVLSGQGQIRLGNVHARTRSVG